MKRGVPILVVFGLMLLACADNSKVLSKETYEGPSVELENVEILFSDSAIVKVKLTAARQLIAENDDMEFPNGIFLEFHNERGRVTSTLKADKGYFFNLKNYYKAEGNVLMHNLNSGDELSTEELIWEPDDEQLRTDKFVTIKTEDEVHQGEGLTADQDFGKYKILKPTGTITIEENKPKPDPQKQLRPIKKQKLRSRTPEDQEVE